MYINVINRSKTQLFTYLCTMFKKSKGFSFGFFVFTSRSFNTKEGTYGHSSMVE